MDEFTKLEYATKKQQIETKDSGELSFNLEALQEEKSPQATMLKQSYKVYKQGYDELINSKRGSHEDSQTMKDVKASFYCIYTSLNNKELPDNKEEFNEQLTVMQDLYKQAIEYCDAYLLAHKGRRVYSIGRYRKNLVKSMRERAALDSYYLEKRATALWTNAQGEKDRPLWVNVLAEVRTKRLDLDKAQNKYTVKSVGENGSTVQKLENKDENNQEGKNFYLKDAEYSNSMEDHFNQIINSKTLKDADKDDYSEEQKSILDWMNEIIKVGEYAVLDAICNNCVEVKKNFNNYLKTEKYYLHSINCFFKIAEVKSIKGYSLTEDKSFPKQIAENKSFITRFLTSMLIHYGTLLNCEPERGNIRKGANLSLRNVATCRMAHLLGIDSLVAQSEMVKYKQNGVDNKDAVIMEEVKGKSCQSVFDDCGKYGGQIVADKKTKLDLNTIELFDAICGQMDRNEGNFMCQVKKEKRFRGSTYIISEPKCIDNDYSFGYLNYKDIKSNDRFNFFAFEDTDGYCRLRLLDKAVVDRLNELLKYPDLIKYAMADLLDEKEINCLINRMQGIQKTIKRTKAKRSRFLVDNYKFAPVVRKRDEFIDSDAELFEKQTNELGLKYIKCK